MSTRPTLDGEEEFYVSRCFVSGFLFVTNSVMKVKTNPIYAAVRRAAQTRLGAALLAKVMHLVDKPLLRWSSGRTSAAALFTGLPIVLLTTTGRKSRKPRTVPLVGIPAEDNKIILIGSNFGGEKNPAWYYNLKANPEAMLVVDGRSQRYTAHQAQDAERQRYWELAAQVYPGYRNYEKWAAHRDIPVMVLTPVR